MFGIAIGGDEISLLGEPLRLNNSLVIVHRVGTTRLGHVIRRSQVNVREGARAGAPDYDLGAEQPGGVVERVCF